VKRWSCWPFTSRRWTWPNKKINFCLDFSYYLLYLLISKFCTNITSYIKEDVMVDFHSHSKVLLFLFCRFLFHVM